MLPSAVRKVTLPVASWPEAVDGVTLKVAWKVAPTASEEVLVGVVGVTVQPVGCARVMFTALIVPGPPLLTVATTRPVCPAVSPLGAVSVRSTMGGGAMVSGWPSWEMVAPRSAATFGTSTVSVCVAWS